MLCPKILPTEGAVDLGLPGQKGGRIGSFSAGPDWKITKIALGVI